MIDRAAGEVVARLARTRTRVAPTACGSPIGGGFMESVSSTAPALSNCNATSDVTPDTRMSNCSSTCFCRRRNEPW